MPGRVQLGLLLRGVIFGKSRENPERLKFVGTEVRLEIALADILSGRDPGPGFRVLFLDKMSKL
jgi:hypothetical protein